MNNASPLALLRQWMEQHHVDAYIVPTADPHNSEYIAPHWMCREWLTGFTGSAGTAVVTLDAAALWTDSRYWLQAADELSSSGFVLMKDGCDGVPTVEAWLEAQAQGKEGTFTVAGPADMVNASMAQAVTDGGMRFEALADAFDAIWTGRPALPAAPVKVQNVLYAGRTVNEKLQQLRTYIYNIGVDVPTSGNQQPQAFMVIDLADIAWLLNLRGADIAYNPVFVSYFIYNKPADRFTLFTHDDTLTDEATALLAENGVEVRPYAEALTYICQTPTAVLADDATVSITTHCPQLPTPLPLWRAVKNEAEAEGFRKAMLRDGVALVQFHRWLDEQMQAGEEVTELSVDAYLTARRAEQPGFDELSFGTIAACGAHGAIVHYEADRHTSVRLPQHGLLLLDSGAQYDCGTTDITRTVALGNLTAEERRVYTLVLKGHLRLARLHFPEGTTGIQLDLAARLDMWSEGYDFGHGTGHGVGSHLCVHEGPQQIRKNVRGCTLVPFEAGMTITDEPGIYVEGKFGVRIENTLLCVSDKETDFGRFLKFETLTLCPYDLRAADLSMLTPVEVEQINNYHLMVRRRLLPLLTDEADKIWLAKATRAIEF